MAIWSPEAVEDCTPGRDRHRLQPGGTVDETRRHRPGSVTYLFVTDVFSQPILSWQVSTSKTTPLVSSALEQTLFTRIPHERGVHHNRAAASQQRGQPAHLASVHRHAP